MSTPISFYKRPLPPHLIPFCSTEGKQIFTEALLDGTMNGFFPLIEQLNTQQEPAYCGLSTLATVLNALGLDPNRRWKGPWRWYAEELLDCCVPLETVQKQGISLDEFQCLAQCNAVRCDLYRPLLKTSDEKSSSSSSGAENGGNDLNEEKKKQNDKEEEKSLEHFRACILKSMTNGSDHSMAEELSKQQSGRHNCVEEPPTGDNNNNDENDDDENNMSSKNNVLPGPFVVVSFDRSVLMQTGTGHFSPIGGYHRKRDLALVLDSARFKYPCYWVDLKLLFDSLKPVDPVTNKSRGYLVLHRVGKSCRSALYPAFCQIYPKHSWQDLVENIRHVVRVLLESDATDLTDLVKLFVQQLETNVTNIIQPFSSLSPLVNQSSNNGDGSQVTTDGQEETLNQEHMSALSDLFYQIKKTEVFQYIRGNNSTNVTNSAVDCKKTCCSKARSLNAGISSSEDVRAILLSVLFLGIPMTLFRESEAKDIDNAKRIKQIYLSSRQEWTDCPQSTTCTQCSEEIDNVRKQLETVSRMVESKHLQDKN